MNKIKWFFVGGDRWWNTPRPEATANIQAGLGPGEPSMTQMLGMVVFSVIFVIVLLVII